MQRPTSLFLAGFHIQNAGADDQGAADEGGYDHHFIPKHPTEQGGIEDRSVGERPHLSGFGNLVG